MRVKLSSQAFAEERLDGIADFLLAANAANLTVFPRNGFLLGVVRHGGFLAGVERFDGRCFGVSPAEANAMDPQQRLVLEVAYEALHGAGARKASLLGDDAGVFLGIERPDWAIMNALGPASARQSVYAATGDTTSVAGGRLSFVLGLQEQRPLV